jgi:hypothetical protein
MNIPPVPGDGPQITPGVDGCSSGDAVAADGVGMNNVTMLPVHQPGEVLSISLALVHGVSGQNRSVLARLVVEMGDSAQLPSAGQAVDALRAANPSAVFKDSTVTILSTKEGDIMPEGSRTTIKGNTTKIEGSTGNISVASAQVSQINVDSIDIQKIREFADLISQIAPALGLNEDQLVELQSGADELREAANAPDQENGRFRHALDRVLKVLRGAVSTAARGIAIGMGEGLVRDLGGEIIKEPPH